MTFHTLDKEKASFLGGFSRVSLKCRLCENVFHIQDICVASLQYVSSHVQLNDWQTVGEHHNGSMGNVFYCNGLSRG